jgi:hypothetical protein
MTSRTSGIPRGYHHVALLLPDGRVAMLGGYVSPAVTAPDSKDVVEIYRPPYYYCGTRPTLSISSNTTMVYGGTTCVEVTSGSPIYRACLIGVSSVTHHFDYGQRYIELMVSPNTSGYSCTPTQLVIQNPLPLPEGPGMAPPGWYMLFVLDNAGRPSDGQFVRVDYQP